jgi:periplasmic protein TonB
MRLIYATLMVSLMAHAAVIRWWVLPQQQKPTPAAPVLQVALAARPAALPVRQPPAPAPAHLPRPQHVTTVPAVRTSPAAAVISARPAAKTMDAAPVGNLSPAMAIASVAPAPLKSVPSSEPVVAPLQQLEPIPESGPEYLENPDPVYPPLARRMRLTGLVLLRVNVDSDGRPQEITLQRTSGSNLLDQAAIDAVQQWKFVPAHKGNVAVSAWVKVPIRFNLDN